MKSIPVLAVFTFLFICAVAYPQKDLTVNGTWVIWNNKYESVPKYSVIGGNDENGPLYVIRAKHFHLDAAKTFTKSYRGKVIGKYSASKKIATVPYYNLEHQKEDFEILLHKNYEFESTLNENRWIPGGYDSFNGTIYICRVEHKGYMIPGKIHIGSCFISYDKYEHEYKKWESLVRKVDL